MALADKALPAMMPALIKALGIDPAQLNGAVAHVAGIATQVDARLTAIENQVTALTYAINNLVTLEVERGNSRTCGNGNPSCGNSGNDCPRGNGASDSRITSGDSNGERGSDDCGSERANGGSGIQADGN